MDNNSSVERMKQLINHGSEDASLKSNVSETVEYKVSGPDGKTYGVVREKQKHFIKESKDGIAFDYIGGIGNKSENEYSSYNSAYRNLELKIREMNTANNTGKIFETFKPAVQAEYIIEATQDMRTELDRFRQITNGAQSIMKENSTEFINKPTFKDPESFGTASDPKKQGAPFEKAPGEYKGDIDPVSSKKNPKNAGEPFEGEVKSQEEKFDIEKTTKAPKDAGAPFTTDAKDVLGNSVATQKPKGGKVFKVTESQMEEVRRIIRESYFNEEENLDEAYGQPDYDAMGGDDDLGTKGWGKDEKVEESYGQPDYDAMAGDDDDFGTKGWNNDEKQKMVKEITEAVLNAFGQHPTYQKPAFTTPANTDALLPGTTEWDDESVKGDKPYGSQIGDSAPFTDAVKQKVGEGQIGEDADDVMKGKTPQGLPNLGEKGDKAPFDKATTTGTPEMKGEKQPGVATLGKKGDTDPFDKEVKKAETLNKIAEAIINDLKKKKSLK